MILVATLNSALELKFWTEKRCKNTKTSPINLNLKIQQTKLIKRAKNQVARNAINKSNKTETVGLLRIEENNKNTFKNISLKKSRVKLQCLITIFNHVLMKLQLTITKRSIAVTERNTDQRN